MSDVINRLVTGVGVLSFLAGFAFAHSCMAQVCPSNLLYVSSDFGHEVLRYDATTGEFIDLFVSAAAGTGLDQPHGILDRGTDVLVASFGTDEVLRYDRDTGALLGVFADSSSGLDNPVYLLIGPDGNVYVSSQASDEVLRYSPAGTFIDAFVSVGLGGLDGPSGMAFGPDGRFYVAGRYSANVVVYDGVSGAFDEVLMDAGDGLASGDTFGLNFGDNGDLYLASNNTLFRFDVTTDSIMTTFSFGFPLGIEPGPNGGIFVAHSNNLSVVDTGDNSVTGSFLTGGAINLLNFFHFSTVEVPGLPGDYDCSGVIDLLDYQALAECLNGPDASPPPITPSCLSVFDSDADDDIDLVDASVFMQGFLVP